MELITGVLIAAAALILLLLLFIPYMITFYSSSRHRDEHYVLPEGEQYEHDREKMFALIRAMESVPFEAVSITSYDGTKLFGRYYETEKNAPLEIEFHGYRGTALRDFCGGNPLARKRGHNTLLVDQRAHGQSGGHTIAFGIRERRDCLEWIRYALSRFGDDTQILLSGVSMGAATVLMASELALPDNVKAIVADSPYSSPEAIIRKVCGDRKLPQKLLFPFISLGARLFGRLNIREADAGTALTKSRIPVLILHGEDDRFVPCAMSIDMARENPEHVRLVTFPGAGHGLSYIADKEKYERVVTEFLSENL